MLHEFKIIHIVEEYRHTAGLKKNFFSVSSGGVTDWEVNTSNSRSGGPGFKLRPLRCFLRQGTLLHLVSLHPGVEIGTGDILLGGNPAMD